MRHELIASDWDIVKAMLPADWEESARQCGALRRARNVRSAEMLLRLILLHVAGGLSLRQTVVRAQALGWGRLSDVALLKRLRASANWLETLCVGLWNQWSWPEQLPEGGRRWRVVDATTVQEPDARTCNWRVHYVIGLPTLGCEFVSVTDNRGGESFCRIPVRPKDVILADAGYSHRAGVAWVLSQGGDVIVRLNAAAFPLLDGRAGKVDLLPLLRRLPQHQPGSWPVFFEQEKRTWPLWLHALRKSAAAAQKAKERLRKEHGSGVQEQTLELAEYVVVLTSLRPAEMAAPAVLSLYRGRWQIELVFKRLKSLLGVGELAKYDPDSARSWLQAKLLTALLLDKLEQEAFFFSPWGYPLAGILALAAVPGSQGQPAAGVGASAAVAAPAGTGAGDGSAVDGTAANPPNPNDTIS